MEAKSLKPELTSQKQSTLISSDSEMFQFRFTGINYLKNTESVERFEQMRQRMFFLFSILKFVRKGKLLFRCAQIFLPRLPIFGHVDC